MSRNRYNQEFKESAVRLLVLEGMSAPEVSRKLGVDSGLLYKWKQQHVSAVSPSEGLDPQALVAELELVRKRLRRSEEINEILKKTVGYFSQELR